jgi:serine protease Do
VGNHSARLFADKPLHDLALIEALSIPGHGIARIAAESPAVGERVFTVGHTAGMYWTFLSGMVSNYPVAINDEDLDIEGPFIEVQMPISHGNSGGGFFNEKGEYVGMCNFARSNVPDAGFGIHLDNIRGFLIGQKLLTAKL